MSRLLLIAGGFLALLAPAANGEESARDILSRMTATYASLQSYSDTGAVETCLMEGWACDETTFQTLFVRPSLFRFDWAEHPFPLWFVEWRSVVWSDGATAFSRYGYPLSKTNTEASLRAAIAGATGVSGGSAHTVPRLLMPEVGGFGLDKLGSPVSVGIEQIGEENCYHIRGIHPRGGAIDLWIGTRDYLIRKVQEQLGRWSTSQEQRRDIRINADIPAAQFLP